MLAMHQDIQDRVVSELNEVYESATTPSTNESISKLDYMEKVIKETMRLLPVGPFLGRQCLADTDISMYATMRAIIIYIIVKFCWHRYLHHTCRINDIVGIPSFA